MNENMRKIVALGAVIAALGATYLIITKKEKAVEEIPAKSEKVIEAEQKPVLEKADEPSPEKKVEQKADAENAPENKGAEEKGKDAQAEPQANDVKEVTSEDYNDTTIAAKIENINQDVTIKDVKDAADMLPPQMRQVPFATLYPVLVRQAVDFIILGHEAKKEGYDTKEDVLKSIKDRGRAVLVGAFLEKEVEAKVSEDTLKAKYEDLKKMIPADEKEFEVAHILVKDEATAKAIIKEIQDGKTTFADALEKSIDSKTKANGGRIGFLKRMEVAPDFFEKVIATKDGEVVNMPLTLGKAGSSIMKVISRRALEAPAFEKVKADIRKAMMPELSQDIVKQIKAKAGLKLFSLEGKEIPEKSEEELKKLDQQAPSAIDASTLSPDFVCAEFNGGKITLKDIRETYQALPEMLRMLPLEKVYELILIRAINERVLYAEAEKAGLEGDKKIQDQIATEKKLIIQEAYLKTKAEALITETDLKAEYNATIKNTADKNEMEYRVRHIATKTEEEAKDILKRLKAGENFDDLVSLSIDEGTKELKGDVGYVRKQQLPAEVGTIVAKTTKGTLINKVLKFSDDLYSVMRVEDKRTVTPPTFEQMKENLKNAMMAKKAVHVLEGLREKYKISYQNVKGLPTSDQIEKVVKAINVKMNEVLETKR
jgi:peptidyl-prolyl cis-trans isomerase C